MKLPVGLRQLDISQPTANKVKSHVLVASKVPSQVYQAPQRPVKGTTELTRQERHSAHLRKRRMNKLKLKEERKIEKEKATQGDRKVKQGLEKRKAMEVLSRSEQVTIIGKDGKLKGQGKERLKMGRKHK